MLESRQTFGSNNVVETNVPLCSAKGADSASALRTSKRTSGLGSFSATSSRNSMSRRRSEVVVVVVATVFVLVTIVWVLVVAAAVVGDDERHHGDGYEQRERAGAQNVEKKMKNRKMKWEA